MKSHSWVSSVISLLLNFQLTGLDFFFFSVTINLHWKAVQMPPNSFRQSLLLELLTLINIPGTAYVFRERTVAPEDMKGTPAVSFGVMQLSTGENVCRKLASNWEVFHAGSASREQQERRILLRIIITNHCILTPSVNHKLPARSISVVLTKYLTDRHSENACWINEWMGGQTVG